MYPALSIVLFTTASGAGFGLFFLLGLLGPLDLLPASSWFGLAGLAVATLFAAGGLSASVFHLGRPERSWRAFSQWRSSWLSREGVCSVLCFAPALIFAIGWIFFGRRNGLFGLCGFLTAALAAASVFCTGMIYASLKPIHQWHNIRVVPNYLLLAVMAGSLVLDFLMRLWTPHTGGITALTLILVLLAWWAKEGYWRFVDTSSARSTVAAATALGSRGRVRLLEAPHTEENYLLKEMGFRIARKHRRRLRLVARYAGFGLPALLSLLGLFWGGIGGGILAGLAILAAAPGLLAERWLFFAEARHTVTLYYGAEAV